MQATATSLESKVSNLHQQRWQDYIRDCREILRIIEPLEIAGRITKLTGLVMEAVGIQSVSYTHLDVYKRQVY